MKQTRIGRPSLLVMLLALTLLVGNATNPILAVHLNTLETVNVGIPGGFIQGRAQQGITSDGASFFTSSGNSLGFITPAPNRLYQYDQSWSPIREQDVNFDSSIEHVGGITADSSYVYAATSNFTAFSSPNYFSFGRYDRSDLTFDDDWNITPQFSTSGDLAGVDFYHDKLMAIEYQTSSDARIVEFALADWDTTSIGNAYLIPSRYANGIEFYGNFAYVSGGSGSGTDAGYIDVYRVDDLSTVGVNAPIQSYTFDVSGSHGEGLAFNGTDLWIADNDVVSRLDSPLPAEYVTWQAPASTTAAWDGFFSWDGKPTTDIDTKFDRAGTFGASATSAQTAKSIEVAAGDVTLSGSTYYFPEGGSIASTSALRAGTDAVLNLSGSLLIQGTLQAAAGTVNVTGTATGDGGAVEDVSFAASSDTTIAEDSTLTLRGTINLDGTMLVQSATTASATTTDLLISGDVTLQGDGTVTLNNQETSNRVAITGNSSTDRLTNHVAIEGTSTGTRASSIGAGQMLLTNHGTISALDGFLVIDTAADTDALVNHGQLEAAGGTLQLLDPVKNHGHIQIDSAFEFTEIDLHDGTIGGNSLVLTASNIVRGTGSINTSVLNDGLISPGNSFGEISIDGDYTQTGNLEIEVGSTQIGEFDRLLITGNANLGGDLQVTLTSGADFGIGDSVVILQGLSVLGTFDSVLLPEDPLGETLFSLVYLPDSVVLAASSSAAGIPEPSSLLLHLFGFCFLLKRRLI